MGAAGAGGGRLDVRDPSRRRARAGLGAAASVLRPGREAAPLVTLPEFLVADPASPAWRSPLRRALAQAPRRIADVTALAGREEEQALGPSAGLAGIEVAAPHAEALLRRLTDLDLDR